MKRVPSMTLFNSEKNNNNELYSNLYTMKFLNNVIAYEEFPCRNSLSSSL